MKTIQAILFLLCVNYGFTQTYHFEWVESFGSTNNDISPQLLIDPTGNPVIHSSYSNSYFFVDSSSINNWASVVAHHNYDSFFAKYLSTGNYQWSKTIRGFEREFISTMIYDNKKNVFIAGKFDGTIDLDPGNLTVLKSSYNTGGFVPQNDGYLIKLDSAYNFDWGFQLGGLYNDNIKDILTDNAGNIYLLGIFRDTIDLNPGPGKFIQNLNSRTSFKNYILKLDNNGKFKWVKTFNLNNSVVPSRPRYSAIIDQQYNIILTGNFIGQLNTSTDSSSKTLNSQPFSKIDIYVLKLDSSGNHLWSSHLGGRDDDLSKGVIELDSSYLLYGTYKDTFQIMDSINNHFVYSKKNTKSNSYIIEYDYNGILKRHFNLSSNEFVSIESINTDKNHIIVVGNFKDSIFLNNRHLISDTLNNSFIIRFDSSFKILAHSTFSGQTGSSVTRNNSTYITGKYLDSAEFIINNKLVKIRSLGRYDGFLLKAVYGNSTDFPSINSKHKTDIKLFPNPTQDGIINVYLSNPSTIKELNVYNSLGILISSADNFQDNNFPITVGQKSGLYLVTIKTEHEVKTFRILKI